MTNGVRPEDFTIKTLLVQLRAMAGLWAEVAGGQRVDLRVVREHLQKRITGISLLAN